jgi:tetratricopeptide (TPR) repeat protein
MPQSKAPVRLLFLTIFLALSVLSRSAAADDQTTCDEMTQKAPDAAIAACSRVIASGKIRNLGPPYNNRGLAYARKGDYDRAIADLNEAIRFQPTNSTSYNNRGYAYFGKRDYDRAVADFEQSIRFDRNHASAYNGRGLCYANKGDYDRAVADYGEAIRIHPNYAIAYANRGDIYRSKGEYDQAIADYNEAIRIDPSLATAFNARGRAYDGKRDYDRAIADYNEAIRITANYAAALTNRGMVYSKKGNYDQAIADLNEAIRIDPKYASAYNNRGLAYFNKSEDERAIEDYDEAIRLNPKEVSAYNNRGLAYINRGDYDRAIADLNEAIRLNPKLANAYAHRGNAYRQKGDIERALLDLSEAIRLDPDFSPAYTYRGLAYERTGDLDRARSDFRAALSRPAGPALLSRLEAVSTARAQLAAIEGAGARTQTATANSIAASPNPGRRVALVVGNSSYGAVSALPNARRDAEAIASSLRQVGFQSVRLETDLSREKLINTLRRFAAEAEQADWAVVYFAGHGIEMGGINYLIPVDARLATDRDVSFDAVSLDQVMNAAENAKKLRLVLLDACRENPFVSQMRRSIATRSVSRGLGRIEPEAGTLVVYAAKHGELALDGDGANSPFVSAFIGRLATPGLEVRRLFDFVRDDVLAATNRRQQPFSYGSLPASEDFFFIAK